MSEIINSFELINRIYNHVENGDTDKAVFACLRLSRSIEDTFNTIIFLRELRPDKKQFDSAFFTEVEHLNKDAQKFLYKTTFEHWLEERTGRFSLDENDPERTVVELGIGEMEKEITHIEKTISDLKIPSGLGEFDAAAFTDRYNELKSRFRIKMSAINLIQERIRTRCLNYASRIEKQIKAQNKSNEFLKDVQNTVNNFFFIHSEETYRKLQKASSLVNSNNPEDYSLLLTSVRRSINSVADYFYPPRKGNILCTDGKERKMGKDEYINRLGEFCATTFKNSTSDELMQAELNYFMTFVVKLNDIGHKGVHSNVNSSEAKQGLVGLYMFLFNVIQKIEINDTNAN